jgi:hypothetical protein
VLLASRSGFQATGVSPRRTESIALWAGIGTAAGMAGPIRAVPIFDPIVQDAKPHIAAKVAELHLQERLADHDRFDVQFPCLPAREFRKLSRRARDARDSDRGVRFIVWNRRPRICGTPGGVVGVI